MKVRPQINGPIDVGYGNYLLTAPPDRAGRREDDGGSTPSGAAGPVNRSARKMKNGKYDVSELLRLSNTLSNPNNSKRRIEL